MNHKTPASCVCMAFALGLAFGLNPARAGAQEGEWRNFGADLANTKYSPLDQIDRTNFKDIRIAWRWEPEIQKRVEAENRRLRPSQFKPTPLMIGGVLYLSTSFSQVVALEADSGKVIWEYDPESYRAGRPANVGFQHRGVAYWADGEDQRILIATHDRRLIALNARTGKPIPTFGEAGAVDLEGSLGRSIQARHITHTSPPGICRDTVIVGSIVFDGPSYKEMPPGHVRGFDVRTGKMKWIFHTIPQKGEFGNETWEEDSWKYSGNTNVWSMFATDEELGYVYMPVSTATNDMYGGHRPGDNLFAESLVCVEVETGKRVWHFQAVHHGLWDYDFPTAPNLVDLTVGGREIKAVAQVSKQGHTYVFDRVTGKALWPIEEREVQSTSTVPGERPAPTQPFPTRPKPFEHQGVTEDDLIDFTPELRAKALKIVEGFTLGPIFTPPTEKGTLGRPSAGGGANWPGAAVDPETGILYVPSTGVLGFWRVLRPDAARSNLRFISGFSAGGGPNAAALEGLPLAKPPYSRVTAIDLNTGDHLWMTPHGDGPIDHPKIKHLDLPPMGVYGSGGGPLLTKTLLFVTQGGSPRGTERDREPKITVFDKKTGEILGRIVLPGVPHGNPITYMHEGRQYIVVALGGGSFFGGPGRFPAEVVALSLP